MAEKIDERLPHVVEERLQEAYGMILRGEIKQSKKQRKAYKRWMGIAAAAALIIALPSAAYAAVVYYQKNYNQEKDKITYEFSLNYELIPGEYQVTAGYMPEGFREQEDGKFRNGDNGWITVMPVYTMAALEKINGEIVVEHIEKVEHTVLSGMEADVITFQEAKKYQLPTHIFLFNERDGYVLQIIAGYSLEKEELLQFADGLHIERSGDGRYETEQEKAAREQEEKDAERAALEGKKNWDTLMGLGIPSDKIYRIGEPVTIAYSGCSYTVTDYEFLDGIAGFEEKDFFEYARFDGWLNEDMTLRPYTRLRYDKDGNLIAEELTQQEVLRVDIAVRNNSGETRDTALNFALQYIKQNTDGVYTWEEGFCDAVPEENYSLQMDNSAVYFDQAVNTKGEERGHFFYRELKAGEELHYTLLFIVDKDREDDFFLYPYGGNYNLWQTESETVGEIRDSLDGYIRLQ